MGRFHGRDHTRGEEGEMRDRLPVSLDLEIEEIESREKAGGFCTSSTTSRRCTCMCIAPTTGVADLNS
jgi:hypothetical protein